MLIQILLVGFIACALVLTWRRASQRVIRIYEALAWSVLWIAAIIVVMLPSIATRIAQIFGVGRGADFVLYASVSLLFWLVFKVMVSHEKLERKLTELVRREALRDLEKIDR